MSDGNTAQILLSHDEIKARFFYNAETGVLYKRGTDTPVGFKGSQGYILVNVDGVLIGAHRIAHMWMLGKWPPRIVDHVNGDPSDNRWGNLRLASAAQNSQNRAPKDDKYYKGVKRLKNGRWGVSVQANWRITQPIGSFDSPKAAHEAYKIVSKQQHGQFARSEKGKRRHIQDVWSAEAQLNVLTERKAEVLAQLEDLNKAIQALSEQLPELRSAADHIEKSREREKSAVEFKRANGLLTSKREPIVPPCRKDREPNGLP